MKSIVRYLSKANHEVRDASGRFEGTFRWRWLASLWATLHPDREMHLVVATSAAVEPALPQAAAAEAGKPRRARAARRRPAVARAA